MWVLIQDHCDSKLMKTSGLVSSTHPKKSFNERWGGSEWDSPGTPERLRGGLEIRLENTSESTPEITYV